MIPPKIARHGRNMSSDESINKSTNAQILNYIGKKILSDLTLELINLQHGVLTLALHIRDSRLTRYTITKEKSYIPTEGGNDNE